MSIEKDKGLTVDDLPRLNDDERQAVDDGYTAMAGVPVGEEPKHTRGPWALRKNSRGEEFGAVIAADGMLVATTGYRASPLSNEDDANARLIASAPELLTVLRSLVATVDAYTTADGRALQETGLMRRARALVSKAEGKQP
jgi:hypothetical protein